MSPKKRNDNDKREGAGEGNRLVFVQAAPESEPWGGPLYEPDYHECWDWPCPECGPKADYYEED